MYAANVAGPLDSAANIGLVLIGICRNMSLFRLRVSDVLIRSVVHSQRWLLVRSRLVRQTWLCALAALLLCVGCADALPWARMGFGHWLVKDRFSLPVMSAGLLRISEHWRPTCITPIGFLSVTGWLLFTWPVGQLRTVCATALSLQAAGRINAMAMAESSAKAKLHLPMSRLGAAGAGFAAVVAKALAGMRPTAKAAAIIALFVDGGGSAGVIRTSEEMCRPL